APINLIRRAVVVIDRAHLASIGDQHFMPEFFQQPADPRRMSSGLQSNPGTGHTPELLLETRFARSHRSFRNDFALLIEYAVMARLVTQIYSHCPARGRGGC